jgi:restriction system protein
VGSAYSYRIEVTHDGLGKSRVVSAPDEETLRAKVRQIHDTWNAQYQKHLAQQREREAREEERTALGEHIEEAETRTQEAQELLRQIENLLHASLKVPHAIDWEKIKRDDPYSKPPPMPPDYLGFPSEPEPSDAKYKPNLTLIDKLVHSREEQKRQVSEYRYSRDHAAWDERVGQIKAENQKRYSESAKAIESWNAESQAHQEQLDRHNAVVDKLKPDYEASLPNAVSEYSELVLSLSEYPDTFEKEFDLVYIATTKILVVDYSLPSPEKMPAVKEVKYVKASQRFVEVPLSATEQEEMYDYALYQVCLRTLYELFDADVINALEAAVFNGWVRSVDKSIGKEVNACVISIQVLKREFQELNLANVDPKACFKKLKGVGSSKLHSLTAVAPVLQLNREDKRFIASREVENRLNEGFNLAAMDWEDFEQLVREIFEKEFTKDGGEVKVTQASRDGGVDAVAFDPDPIHGGKIVIQAKRYTNTVGVSFVRELWGTVLNEGAMKGILITTADYGPDAYEFAKGKPITLMNGANLLYLLEKHGRKAKIDIKEAKKILGESI